jgi:hypothetical protein
LYVSIRSPLAGDRHLVNGGDWAAGRRALSRNGNFFSTCISHSLGFRGLVHRVGYRGLRDPPFPLMLSAVLPPIIAEAALVASAREPMAGCLGLSAAVHTTVLLPAEVPSADMERPRAPAADQLVEKNGVHPAARMDRNWTTASGSARLRAYGPSAGLYL